MIFLAYTAPCSLYCNALPSQGNGSIFVSSIVSTMSARAVDAVFQGLYLLTDIRMMMRKSVPDHILTEDEKKKVAKTLDKLEKQIAILREEMVA